MLTVTIAVDWRQILLLTFVLFMAMAYWQILKRPKKKPEAPKPCPHGHEDWNECPVCGH